LTSSFANASILACITVAPAKLCPKIATFRPSQLRKRISERRNQRLRSRIAIRPAYQHADQPHSVWLLRPRGKRPHRGSAANYFDDVASSHCLPQNQGQRIVSAQLGLWKGPNGAVHAAEEAFLASVA
jgi:hypothetical protein